MMVNGNAVQLYQVGHQALIKGDAMYRRQPVENPSVKLNGANCVEIDMDGFQIMIDKPIPNRPKVVRVTTSDGRRSILGDFGTYSDTDARALRSAVDKERTYWRHFLDEKENKALADAEQDLQSALKMVEESSSKLELARINLKRFTVQHDGHLDEPANRQDIHRLERMVDAAHGEWLESRRLEGHARSALIHTEQYLGRIARIRMPQEEVGSIVGPKEITEENWREKLHRSRQP